MKDKLSPTCRPNKNNTSKSAFAKLFPLNPDFSDSPILPLQHLIINQKTIHGSKGKPGCLPFLFIAPDPPPIHAGT
jgi:hypothetical protein